MNEPSPPKMISIVVPCYNEGEVFPHLRQALAALLSQLQAEFRTEVILVDDGSTDSTWRQIQEFSSACPGVCGLALSRNFGHQAALTCGYDMASGDAIICLDADLQDPPEVIHEMVRLWQQGNDIVYAVRRSRAGESAFKLWTAAAFYRLIRAMGASCVRADTGDFRLMSRRSLDALRKLREQHRFIRGMVGWIGFQTAEVHYERKERKAGVTKYPLRKMLHFAFDAIVSFSVYPLRISYFSAFVLTLAIMGYLGYAFLNHLLFGAEIVPGWSSLILAVIGFGAMNLICLGFMGEYVGRIYEQMKDRPLYLVKDSVGAQDELEQRSGRSIYHSEAPGRRTAA